MEIEKLMTLVSKMLFFDEDLKYGVKELKILWWEMKFISTGCKKEEERYRSMYRSNIPKPDNSK